MAGHAVVPGSERIDTLTHRLSLTSEDQGALGRGFMSSIWNDINGGKMHFKAVYCLHPGFIIQIGFHELAFKNRIQYRCYPLASDSLLWVHRNP